MKKFYERHLKTLSVITLICMIVSTVFTMIVCGYEIDDPWFNYVCIAWAVTLPQMGWHCFMTVVALIEDL